MSTTTLDQEARPGRAIRALMAVSRALYDSNDLDQGLKTFNAFLADEISARIEAVILDLPRLRSAIGTRAPDPREQAAINDWKSRQWGTSDLPPVELQPSVALIPLLRGGRVVGGLRVSTHFPMQSEERAIFETISAGSAQLISRALLVGALDKSRRRHSTRPDVSDRIRKTLAKHASKSLLEVGRCLELRADKSAEGCAEALRRFADVSFTTHRELRRNAMTLSLIDKKGRSFGSAIRSLGRRFSMMSHVSVRVRVGGKPTMPEKLADALYRAILEALLETEKGSRAESVVISVVDRNGVLKLKMRDDGVGLARRVGEENGSFVQMLRRMKRNLSAVGASVKVSDAAPRGVTLEAVISTDHMSIPKRTMLRPSLAPRPSLTA